jgi:hypothetical protein
MADRSLRGRLIEGIISLGLGTVMGVVAIFAAPSPGMYDLRPWLWTMAGVTAAEGVVTLAWTPARESLSRQYARMPYATARERHARIRFGEHALDEMASDGSRRRILSSVAGAVIPAGLLLVLYRDPIFNHAPYTFGVFDYLIIGFAGIEVVTSLLGLISRSDEERLRDMYRQQMQMRESEMRTPDQ